MGNKEASYLTNNNQPVKKISYQSVYRLQETIEQLNSWEKPLNSIHEFFLNEEPLNKKKIVREFHANSILFIAFYQQFSSLMFNVENQLEELAGAEKVRMKQLK